jgi:hypothetical protein
LLFLEFDERAVSSFAGVEYTMRLAGFVLVVFFAVLSLGSSDQTGPAGFRQTFLHFSVLPLS